jgi:ATP-binding cassette subfamily C protein PrsD
MVPSLMARFRHLSDRHVSATLNASDVISGVGAFAKVFRQILQSASLGLGAYLAIHGEVSAGGIVAASILTSRALAPIETAVANWRGFIVARQSLQRLEKALAANPPAPERQPLPAPQLSLIVEDLVVASPDRTKPILNGISLNLTAGDALGIIGPTGSGKSTLARALVGVCSPVRGAVRIDGATLDQWGQDLGRHVGYLPQDIEMFGGTISDNIARFAAAPDRAAVIAAAKAASAHEMILSLPKGYDMLIGPGGTSLSGGQRQRIALARALYGEPFLIVLDEPNANLDGEGDDALNGAIRGLRERGAIVAVITHRPSGLASANLVAILKEGRIVASGPRDQMLQSMLQPAQSSPMRQTPRTVSK